MEILSDILALGFLVALVVLIVFGVEWFKHRKDKEALEYRQWKKKFWIVFTVCAGLFVLTGITTPDDDSTDEASEKTEQTGKSSSAENKAEDDKTETESTSKETIKQLTEALNTDLVTEDAGNTKWSWNGDNGCWEATLDPNSTMYQSMDEGQVSIWNSYVRDITEESQTAKDEKLGFMSTFKVLNPTDTGKCFLVVDNGKVKYNIGEDLGN